VQFSAELVSRCVSLVAGHGCAAASFMGERVGAPTALAPVPKALRVEPDGSAMGSQFRVLPDQWAELTNRCSAPGKLEHFELEFSAVISLAGRSGNDEGIKVHRRPEGVHP
jgi:hypothetical protein